MGQKILARNVPCGKCRVVGQCSRSLATQHREEIGAPEEFVHSGDLDHADGSPAGIVASRCAN